MRSGKTGRPGKAGSTRVRSKVVALIVSLAALWAFAAYVTVREGTNLLALNTLANRVGLTGEALTAALQDERRASLLYIPSPTEANLQALAVARNSTDVMVADFAAGAHDSTVNLVASDRLKELDRRGHRPPFPAGRHARGRRHSARSSVTRRSPPTRPRSTGCSTSTAPSSPSTTTPWPPPDARSSWSNRALEMLRQEDAMLAGALAAGTINGTEHARFVQLVGAQRFLFDEAINEFRQRHGRPAAGDHDQPGLRPAAGHGEPDRDLPRPRPASGPDCRGMGQRYPRCGHRGPPVHPRHQPARPQMAVPVAAGVLVRLVLAGGLGLIAVIASIVISITTARTAGPPARAPAQRRPRPRLLPAARGWWSGCSTARQVDVAAEAPPLDFGRDEIGQVGQAFNQVQETAIRVAVEQAELRRSVRDVFLSLARRSQAPAAPPARRCSTRWSAARPTPRSWPSCSASTTSPPACAATRRT